MEGSGGAFIFVCTFEVAWNKWLPTLGRSLNDPLPFFVLSCICGMTGWVGWSAVHARRAMNNNVRHANCYEQQCEIFYRQHCETCCEQHCETCCVQQCETCCVQQCAAL